MSDQFEPVYGAPEGDKLKPFSVLRIVVYGAILLLGLVLLELLHAVFTTQDGRAWLHGSGLEALSFHGSSEVLWSVLSIVVHLGAVAVLIRAALSDSDRTIQPRYLSRLLATCLLGLALVLIWRNLAWVIPFPDILGDGYLYWRSAIAFGMFSLLQLIGLASVWISMKEGCFASPLRGLGALGRAPVASLALLLLLVGLSTLSWTLAWSAQFAHPLWFPESTGGFPKPDLFDLPGSLLPVAWQGICTVITLAVQVIGTGWITGAVRASRHSLAGSPLPH